MRAVVDTRILVRAAIRLIVLRGELIRPDRRIVACRDPRADKFLEVATSGRAQAIVSGDEDLLTLNPFERIPIVAPARFPAMLDNDGAV